jgi:hypothetical protein
MKPFATPCLAAVLAGPVHARVGSGGNGGVDVTGNQCGEAPAAAGVNFVAQAIRR